MWNFHKDKQILQRNKLERKEINPLISDPLISNKDVKAIQWAKVSLFKKWCWNEMGICMGKNIILDLYFMLYTEIYAKWITDPNAKAKFK